MAFTYSENHDGVEAGRVEVVGRIVGSTPLAIELDGPDGRHWLPLSKIIQQDLAGGQTRVLLPKWLARKKGIICDAAPHTNRRRERRANGRRRRRRA